MNVGVFTEFVVVEAAVRGVFATKQNTLLPKLISGGFRVNHAEGLIEVIA